MDATGLGIFEAYVNWQLVLTVIFVMEFLKIYIPDNIEAKLLPGIAVIVGGLLSLLPMLHISLITGLASGFTATSCYALGNTGIDKVKNMIKEATNGNKTDTPK